MKSTCKQHIIHTQSITCSKNEDIMSINLKAAFTNITTYKHTPLLSMVHTKVEGGNYYNGLISNVQLWKWDLQSSTKFNHT